MEKIVGVTDLEESEVLQRFRELRARMAEASTELSDEEVATEVAAALEELRSE